MYLDGNHYQTNQLVTTMIEAVENQMRFDLVQKTGARLMQEGNQWCYILGDMPENYIAGFGDSPRQAMENFWNEFHKPIKSII